MHFFFGNRYQIHLLISKTDSRGVTFGSETRKLNQTTRAISWQRSRFWLRRSTVSSMAWLNPLVSGGGCGWWAAGSDAPLNRIPLRTFLCGARSTIPALYAMLLYRYIWPKKWWWWWLYPYCSLLDCGLVVDDDRAYNIQQARFTFCHDFYNRVGHRASTKVSTRRNSPKTFESTHTKQTPNARLPNEVYCLITSLLSRASISLSLYKTKCDKWRSRIVCWEVLHIYTEWWKTSSQHIYLCCMHWRNGYLCVRRASKSLNGWEMRQLKLDIILFGS